jgi:hypothetical protein
MVDQMNITVILGVTGMAITIAANVAAMCIFAYRQGVWQGKFGERVDQLSSKIEMLQNHIDDMRKPHR